MRSVRVVPVALVLMISIQQGMGWSGVLAASLLWVSLSAEQTPGAVTATPRDSVTRTESSKENTPSTVRPQTRSETPAALASRPTPVAGSSGSAHSGVTTDDDEVLQLDAMTVTFEQKSLPKKAEVRDARALLDEALKAAPGLRMGPFKKLNHALALEMQKEAREAAARARLIEHVENLPAMDEERAKEEVRLMRAATARPNTDWKSGRR